MVIRSLCLTGTIDLEFCRVRDVDLLAPGADGESETEAQIRCFVRVTSTRQGSLIAGANFWIGSSFDR